jgi:hypothetical protein
MTKAHLGNVLDAPAGEVVLDLITGELYTMPEFLPRENRLSIHCPTSTTPPLGSLLPLAQRIIEGRQGDGRLNLDAEEAYDAMSRYILASA